jgi:hypothetical protein
MRLGCAIAYRRLSALGRDNIARSRSHAVASSRDLDPGCLLALFTTSISPNTSTPAFFLPTYSSLLPDSDTCICTCCLHIYYHTLNPASSLTQSGGIHRRPQYPRQQLQASLKRIHQPSNRTSTCRSITQQNASQLPHLAIYSRNTIPKHFLHPWSQTPATA